MLEGLKAAEPYLIEQDCAAYTVEQHAIWSELVSRRMPQLREHACAAYLEGFEQIGLQVDRLPDLSAVSARLQPRDGVEFDAGERISAGECVL